MKEGSEIWPLPIQKRIESAQHKRLERYAEYAGKLKDKGYIKEYVPYEDPHGFADRDLSTIPKDERELIGHLVDIAEGSILEDDIEEQFDEGGGVIKGTRKHIRDYAHSLGDEAYHFYDYNKLQASNISNALHIVSFIQMGVKFSDETTQEYEALCKEFTEGDSHAFKIDTYYKLNKKEKYAFVEKYTKLIEDVLEETFEHYHIQRNADQ
jgi:hypothetical protein